MTAAKKVSGTAVGCSCSTDDTVLSAELGMYPLKRNIGVRKLQYKLKK